MFYSYLGEFSCYGGTGPCQPTSRGYLIHYPGYTRVNLQVSQQLWRALSAYVSVDNLTNNIAYQGYDVLPVEGRVTMVGLRVHY